MSRSEGKLFKGPEGAADRLENQGMSDAVGKESSPETEHIPGEPFREAQKELADTALQQLEGMHAIVESLAYVNAKLKIDATAISGEKSAAIQQRIQQLNERAGNLYDIYSAKMIAFTRAAVFAAIPVLLANSGDVLSDSNRGTRLEQAQGIGLTFREVVARANVELQKKGITTEQKAGYIPGINDMLHKGIDSYSYEDYWNKTKDFLPNVLFGRKEYNNTMEDAYRMYLGIAQKHKTFGISDYQPTQSTEQKYYYKIDAFFEKLIVRKYGNDGQKMIRDVLSKIEAGEGFDDDGFDMIMGHYKMGKGVDKNGPYISYYDRWDLDAMPVEGTNGSFGKPYEIYDRIYYNANSFEPIYKKDVVDQLRGRQLQNYKKSV